jgi:hypothetical protein
MARIDVHYQPCHPITRTHVFRNTYDTNVPLPSGNRSQDTPVSPVCMPYRPWVPRFSHMLTGYVAFIPTACGGGFDLVSELSPYSCYEHCSAATCRHINAAVLGLFSSKSRTRKIPVSMLSKDLIWTILQAAWQSMIAVHFATKKDPCTREACQK